MHSRLEVTNLHSYYGDSHVLQGCSLTVEAECTCVLGRNGMGKTTLMRSIMGLTPPRDGTVMLNGKDLTRAKPERVAQAGIGYCLLYTSPSPRDRTRSRMPSSA